MLDHMVNLNMISLKNGDEEDIHNNFYHKSQ